MSNPYLTNDGLDPQTSTIHCIKCQKRIISKGVILEPYIVSNWKHYGFIYYPDKKATDPKGKTLEDKIKVPARTALAVIPVRTFSYYCIPCFYMGIINEGCGICTRYVQGEYSKGEFLENNNGKTRYWTQEFHIDCLPEEYEDVRTYISKYRG